MYWRATALAAILALGLMALPQPMAAQDSSADELEIDDVDEDELLELESFKSDESIPDINEEAVEEADAEEESDADSEDVVEQTARTVSEQLADPSGLQEYRLGPGDRLSIVVFGQDDLSGELAVDGQGRISMPLIGQVQAQNKTVDELQQIVTDLLSVDYLIDPRISVEVTNYRPFYIRPGQQTGKLPLCERHDRPSGHRAGRRLYPPRQRRAGIHNAQHAG